MGASETRDLGEILPAEAFDHPDCFDSHEYASWEREVAAPLLRAQGYEVVRWFSGDEDSFGPLVRCVELLRDGETTTWCYG